MDKLVSCICCTYDRPNLLNEMVYCFLQQDYKNKELIILNDQKNIVYNIYQSNIEIINTNYRFNSLGEKREYSKKLARGEYVMFWDDDDIYYSNHISSLVDLLDNNNNFDIGKNRFSHLSINNIIEDDKTMNTMFAAMCFTKNYVNTHHFNKKNVGEDIDFISEGRIIESEKIVTFNYRWGMGIKHISGYGDNPDSWILCESNNLIEKKIKINPKLSNLTKKYYR